MNCKEGTRLISDQMIVVLQQLNDDIYARPLAIFNGSSLGQHFRHILDFYQCLLKGIDKDVVDYCNRERNPLLETQTATAIEVLQNINANLRQLEEQKIVAIRSDFSENEAEERVALPSSLGRELMFAFDHALHHLALIKIGLQVNFPDIEIDPDLGVAPSTLKYRKTACAVTSA